MRLIIAIAVSLFSAAALSQAPLVCDVNGDGQVDVTDITIIRMGIGQPTFPGDPRDANGDGKITINDVRFCVLHCTHANCAP